MTQKYELPQTNGTNNPLAEGQAEELGLTEQEVQTLNQHKQEYDESNRQRGFDLGPQAEASEEQAEEAPILGKFKTQEDLEKAYQELEKKLGSPQEAKPEEVAQKEETPETPEAPEIEFKSEHEEGSMPFNIDKANHEILTEGKLSDELVETMKEAGVPEELIREQERRALEALEKFQNEEQQKAETQASEEEAKAIKATVEELGGEEQVAKIQDWAGKNLEQEEIDYIEGVVENGSLKDIAFVYKNLQMRMDASKPTPVQEKMISPQSLASEAVDRYESEAQMLQDMADPRYTSDPAFRERVMQKAYRSR